MEANWTEHTKEIGRKGARLVVLLAEDAKIISRDKLNAQNEMRLLRA